MCASQEIGNTINALPTVRQTRCNFCGSSITLELKLRGISLSQLYVTARLSVLHTHTLSITRIRFGVLMRMTMNIIALIGNDVPAYIKEYPRRQHYSVNSSPTTRKLVSPRTEPNRSQWPRGLRHELSSPARTLGSWVRISLEAWMSVCVYSMFVLPCVQVADLRRAYHSSKESYRLCKRLRN
jgi:hypothetical protein